MSNYQSRRRKRDRDIGHPSKDIINMRHRDRHKERHTERHRDRHTVGHTEAKRETQRQRQTYRETQRETETNTETDGERHTERREYCVSTIGAWGGIRGLQIKGHVFPTHCLSRL